MNQLVRLPVIAKELSDGTVLVGRHGMASDPMFANDALMDLVLRSYMVRGMNPELRVGSSSATPQTIGFARDFMLGEAEVEGLFAEIATGKIWLTIDRVDRVDARLRAITDQLYDDIGQQLPGFSSVETTVSLHISSPMAESPFQVHGPSEIVWQIRGGSDLRCYPADEKFVPRHVLEDVFVGCHEGVMHDSRFDLASHSVNLVEGEVAIWPQNAPRRQINSGELNVTLVTHHFTKEARRKSRVYQANRFLRTTFGVSSTRLSVATQGPCALAKVIAHKAGKKAGLEHRPEPASRFPVDRSLPGRKATPKSDAGSVMPINSAAAASGAGSLGPSPDVAEKQPVAIG